MPTSSERITAFGGIEIVRLEQTFEFGVTSVPADNGVDRSEEAAH